MFNPNDMDNVFSLATLTRLARKAGIKAMSSIALKEIHGNVYTALENLLPKIALYVEHARRKTVLPIDVKRAITQLVGETTHQHEETIGKCKSRVPKKYEKDRWLKNARFYQKQSDCLYLPKSTFKTMIVSDVIAKVPLRWSPAAVDQLQIYIEMSLISLLQDANLCAIHAKRQTVQPHDITLAIRVSRHKLFNLFISPINIQLF